MNSVIRVGMSTCGLAAGAQAVYLALDEQIRRQHLPFSLVRTGCLGACHREPLVEVVHDGAAVLYGPVTPAAVPALVAAHLGCRPAPAAAGAGCQPPSRSHRLPLSRAPGEGHDPALRRHRSPFAVRLPGARWLPGAAPGAEDGTQGPLSRPSRIPTCAAAAGPVSPPARSGTSGANSLRDPSI